MNTSHTPPTPEQPAPQDAPTPPIPAPPKAATTRTRSERIWMYVGIGSLSLLLLGGAVATGAFVASANDDRADRVEINTNDGRGDDRHDDKFDDHSDTNDSSPSDSNSQATPKAQSQSIDVDNNGAVPLDDATISAISKAALAAAGGSGIVTDIENEQDSNKAYAYEVEVERADRSEVTIYLDKSYKVLKTVEDDTWD